MSNRLRHELGTSPVREFAAGFCDGFGFSGLFRKLEQPELPPYEQCRGISTQPESPKALEPFPHPPSLLEL